MKKKVNISDKALELINVRQIKPIPRWEFVVKNWGIWLGLVVCLTLLALGIGVSWFGLADNVIVPYLWILIAIVFLALSFLVFEKTKKAYRFNRGLVLIFIMVIGIVVGGILFGTGMANQIDKGLGSRSAYYRQVVPMKLETWNRPELGYLSGVIVKVTGDESFEIQDFSGKTWKISGQEILVKGKVKIETGREIKLIGEKTSDNEFVVKEIRPWTGRQN